MSRGQRGVTVNLGHTTPEARDKAKQIGFVDIAILVKPKEVVRGPEAGRSELAFGIKGKQGENRSFPYLAYGVCRVEGEAGPQVLVG